MIGLGSDKNTLYISPFPGLWCCSPQAGLAIFSSHSNRTIPATCHLKTWNKMRTRHKALISSFVTCYRKAFQTRGLSGCSRRQDQVRNPSPALTMVTLCTHYLLRLWTNLGKDDWSARLSWSSHWPVPPEKELFWKERKNNLKDNRLTRKNKLNENLFDYKYKKTNSTRTWLTTNIQPDWRGPSSRCRPNQPGEVCH